ncbi:MAG TPA: PEP/pyruvate-binding domain-containing protein, partial [Anaerolineae bacterium]|nr:PEP/pyruvate-binding domain-containing protein [Anaerolineae bacterium]
MTPDPLGTYELHSTPKVLQLYLEISQYPILAKRIREHMRREMFARGVISPQAFEEEVRNKATLSQRLEGLLNPIEEEPAEVWQRRIDLVRDNVTDFYFAHNLPHDLFKEIVQDIIAQRAPQQEVILSFNPELAPWSMLFAQGETYENSPPEKRQQVEHHLREIIVVLIKGMISDQLAFVRVAREYFTIEDLREIHSRRIGRGKIGGKAAGMLLAYNILQRDGQLRGIDVERWFKIPDSYFLASDVFYEFHQANNLFRFMNQKYKSHEQMRTDYPPARDAYLKSRLPEYVRRELASVLNRVQHAPLIVRSSSLLEDNFETSFAGKYDSFFLPNQGAPEENLHALENAIIRVYASVIRPDALIYREQTGLTDYDERMAILIQKVEGQRYGRYFFPPLAGVAFSRNPYRWSPRIRLEDGLLRMVTGLGTRAVERVGSDYPRMVALSHPSLRPEHTAREIRRYSQSRIDVLDLEENAYKTLDVDEVLDRSYPGLGAIASVDQGDYLRPLVGRPLAIEPGQLVITFDRLLQSPFADVMRRALDTLEQVYGRPVDAEFAGEVIATYPALETRIALLQCRPLSQRDAGGRYEIPRDIPAGDVLFTASRQVPHGRVENVRYIVYVDPRAYARIPDSSLRIEIGQVVGRLNHILAGQRFILMGPGRWGTANLQLGVKVTYADIYNTSVLIEIAHEEEGTVPEVSYGTHFFQDLVEADIYPLPLYPDDPDTTFRDDFLLGAPSVLPELLPDETRCAPYVRVIDVPAVAAGQTLTIVMNAEEDRAIGYLVRSSS